MQQLLQEENQARAVNLELVDRAQNELNFTDMCVQAKGTRYWRVEEQVEANVTITSCIECIIAGVHSVFDLRCTTCYMT